MFPLVKEIMQSSINIVFILLILSFNLSWLVLSVNKNAYIGIAR